MDKQQIEEIRKNLRVLRKEFGVSATIIQEYLEGKGCINTPKVQSINAFIRGSYPRLNDDSLRILEQFIKDKKQVLEKL